MAWSAPLTATASTALTAAQWNASVRDNLLETPAALATAAGRIFVSSGANAIQERQILDAIVSTGESTASTSYTSLATDGPSLSMVTGVKALIWINAQCSNTGASATSVVSFEITGATTTPADDTRSLIVQSGSASQDIRCSVCTLMATTPGTNTFRMLYRCTSGTSTFTKRRLQVMGL